MQFNLRTIGRRILPYLPRSVGLMAKRIYHRVLVPASYSQTATNDLEVSEKYGIPAFPPPELRHRVHGAADLESFLEQGRQNQNSLVEGIGKFGGKFSEIDNILDFGCGCGRTAIWWKKLFPQKHFHGTDIDRESIDWATKNVTEASFKLNQSKPPLDYPSRFFDLVYSISVFTHLDADYQDYWLAEIQRVTKPGGWILLTVHSDKAISNLPEKLRAEVDANGILFLKENIMSNVFPDFYQVTYHSEEYIREHWTRFFQLQGKVPIGSQDIYVFRNFNT